MPQTIPEKMRAIVLSEYREDVFDAISGLQVLDRSVPKLRRGQVLVKVAAAPCNPSDLLLLQGRYGTLKTLPTVPGWEGAGTVVATGGGWMARWLQGKRVACALRADRDGTWAEYFVADANKCIPLKATLPFEQAASLIINPLTAMGLLDTARRAGHKAAVHTVGASQLGRMTIAMAADMNYPLVNVVRRDAQAELLQSLGAKHVLNSTSERFVDELQSLCRRLNATAAFEAVAGEMTGTVLNAMPPGSTAYVYGGLSYEPCGNIDPIELIFHEKSVVGFYLGNWLDRRGPIGILRAAGRVQRLIVDGRIGTSVQRRLTFDEAVDGLHQYVNNMTVGKVLITPHGRELAPVL
ncbi:MAG TPA: zinc-binding dehydrogenase [Lacipirellulaceae bacterium]|nr:zinc-binding dehydrogenase [Lacipirellulaceae bacterium]